MKAMRMLLLLAVGIALVALVAVKQSHWSRVQQSLDKEDHVGEDMQSRTWRFEKEAEENQRIECTNKIIGFRRILESTTRTRGDDVSKWTGRARVEVINQSGGIEVTNVEFKFQQFSGHASWYLDEAAIARSNFDAWQKSISK
jgi:hypothetical protein